MKKAVSLMMVFALLLGLVVVAAAQDDLEWGTSVECDGGGEIEDGISLVIVQQRSGNQYTVTAVGIDDFDPVLAVSLEDDLDDALCSDDERDASYYQADLPTTGEIEGGRNTSQIVFNLNSNNDFENVAIVVGSADGEDGEFLLIIEGMYAAGESDGAGDPFSLYVSPALVESEVVPTAYMVSITEGLDSLIYFIDEDYDALEDEDGNIIGCDDAGSNTCWGDSDDLSDSFVSRTDNRSLAGWEYDAMLSIPIDEDWAGSYLNYAMAGNNSTGDYLAAFHLAWASD
jgi:hypothetical protein